MKSGFFPLTPARSLGRNDSVGDDARPHPGPLPRGEGEALKRFAEPHRLVGRREFPHWGRRTG